MLPKPLQDFLGSFHHSIYPPTGNVTDAWPVQLQGEHAEKR